MSLNKVFYASGEKGKEVRADGKGGVMPRGWYAKTVTTRIHNGGTFGPFKTKTEANLIAFGTPREDRNI